MAILNREAEAQDFVDLIAGAISVKMSVGTYVELGSIVESAKDSKVSGLLDDLLKRSRIELIPMTARQAFRGREAYGRFGKGSGHPAKLNLGDCFSYALAKDLDLPLLFKGNDFTHTDVRRAL